MDIRVKKNIFIDTTKSLFIERCQLGILEAGSIQNA